ncbi:MAG: glycosyltransferase [Pseudomonadota bacterium]
MNKNKSTEKSEGGIGFIDSISVKEVTGWYCRRNARQEGGWGTSEKEKTVYFYIQGKLIGTAECTRYRDDLNALGYPECAFLFQVPRDCIDLIAEIQVKSSLGQYIDKSPAIVYLPRFDGYILGANSKSVYGYALDRLNPFDLPDLEVMLDGKVITHDTGSSDLPSEDANGFKLYVLNYADSELNCEERRVEVRVANSLYFLSGGGVMVVVSKAPATKNKVLTNTGRVDVFNGRLIQGWALANDLNSKAIVDLVVEDQLVASTVANIDRSDVAETLEIQNSYCGFQIKAPLHLCDGFSRKIEIKIRSAGKVGTIYSATRTLSKFIALVEKIDVHGARGWIGVHSGLIKQENITIKACVNNAVISCSALGSIRHDIVEGGNLISACAFRLYFDPPITEKCNIDLIIDDSDFCMKGSPFALDPKEGAFKLGGQLDYIDKKDIAGWAVNIIEQEQLVDLDLHVDSYFMGRFTTNTYRGDVLKSYPRVKNPGFRIATPSILLDGCEHLVLIKSVTSGEILFNSPMKVSFKKSQALSLESKNPLDDYFKHYRGIPKYKNIELSKSPIVSIIILNRNGGELLDFNFRSLLRWHQDVSFEIIFVDHNSSDNSRDVVDFWSLTLPIKKLYLTENRSFSESNNSASKIARGKYFLILNNDIIFVQNIIKPMIEILNDENIGVVGCKLLDVIDVHSEISNPPMQHIGVRFQYPSAGVVYHPHDEKFSPYSAECAFSVDDAACTTGAVMLVRAEEFRFIGGFCEDYFYGYEDVDICLKYRSQLNKRVVSANNLSVMHHRGYTRLTGREQAVTDKLSGNGTHLRRRFGYSISKNYFYSLIGRDRIYTAENLHICFAVTEVGANAKAGDYFTALELARELMRINGVKVSFLSADIDWYDLRDVNVLVVMCHDYNLQNIRNSRADLISVAWIRNHFESWDSQCFFKDYSIYLSSSLSFCNYISEKFKCDFFPIAANSSAFSLAEQDVKSQSDYCFTGSFWGSEREFVSALSPSDIDYKFRIFGAGWEGNDKYSSYSEGFVQYSKIPAVYASTKLVIDDANKSAKKWGSVNSRVFDALSAGRLVITNSQSASDDLFDGLLPVWNSENINSEVTKFLSNDEYRSDLAGKLSQIVLEKHTYEVRALSFMSILERFSKKLHRISIKVAVPNNSERHKWGDWHFATSLASAFKSSGHSVFIDIMPDWYQKNRIDDVVIVLRGLDQYRPDASNINLMWLLSHPTTVSIEELKSYDHVFVASASYAKKLKSYDLPASELLQCTDEKVFFRDDSDAFEAEFLFVGNSRLKKRRIVIDCLSVGIDLSVYGADWEGMIPVENIKGGYIENSLLRKNYSSAAIVFNDHWDDMRKYGFISNRIFDAGACGACVISDDVEGLSEVFGDSVIQYVDQSDLSIKVDYCINNPSFRERKSAALAKIIHTSHTFSHRVKSIIDVIESISKEKLMGKVDSPLA